MYVYIFIEINNYTYINICIYTIFLKKICDPLYLPQALEDGYAGWLDRQIV
jgi:hypothetical protein